MTAKTKQQRVPSFRHHKASGQGFVELNGRRVYLGRYDLPETQEKYHQTIAEWIANGRRVPVPPAEVTVVELCVAFTRHARDYYRKADGTPTSEVEDVRLALRPVQELYGRTNVADFGPRKLKAVRQWFVDRDCARTYINRHVDRIKRMFKWGTAEEMVPSGVYHGLQAVAGLKRGRTQGVRETDPVRPAPQAHVDAIRNHVASPVWALVQLQLLTAARPGELLRLRAIDFDTSGDVWTATLRDHKTAHHGRERTIYFGPQAIAVVQPFMSSRPLDAYLFSPREAKLEHERNDAHCRRRPNQAPNKTKTERRLGECYTIDSYRRAIHRACAKAKVPQWSPGQLRHNAATEIRKRFGVEAAQLLLGHARADVTQLYAEVNQERAFEVAAKVG